MVLILPIFTVFEEAIKEVLVSKCGYFRFSSLEDMYIWYIKLFRGRGHGHLYTTFSEQMLNGLFVNI